MSELAPEAVREASAEAVQRLDRASWIAAARAEFIAHGYAAVKVDRLATKLGITRGSFYWHFRSRGDLLDAILADWQDTNSRAILAALQTAGSPVERLRALAAVWLDEREYSPAYDSAVRDWARVSGAVRAAVRLVDDIRIAALEPLFRDAGCPAQEAFIRARVTYFHQVGYYAMGIRETREVRDRYLDLYIGVLLGSAPPR